MPWFDAAAIPVACVHPAIQSSVMKGLFRLLERLSRLVGLLLCHPYGSATACLEAALSILSGGFAVNEETGEGLTSAMAELRAQNAALKISITDHISAQLAAEEFQRYTESVLETVRGSLLILDADLKILAANRNFYETFHGTPAETLGVFIYDLGNGQWDIPGLRALLAGVLENKVFNDFKVSHDFNATGPRSLLLNARQIYRRDTDTRTILLAIEDVTERMRLEGLLTESEERFRRLFETAGDGILLLEKSAGKITHANPAVEKMLGYSHGESIGKGLQEIGVLLDLGDFQRTMENLNRNGILNYSDVPVITKAGLHIDTDIYLVDKARLVQCNIRDITQRKRAADEVILNAARLRSLVNILQHPSVTIQDFLEYALEQAIELTKSKIGYIYHYHEERRELVLNTWSRDVMAACAVENPMTGYSLEMTGLWGEAIRQRRSMIINDFQAFHPLKKGYPEGHVPLLRFLTVPIFKDDRIVGVIGLANKESDYGETDILQASLLMETVWKVTDRKHAEEKLRLSLEQLRRAVETTIQVLVLAVEMKDPYTAGHQRRAADLARAMAAQMGLPPEKIEGLRMAGVIHDIGKITLPIEIMSKPSPLSDIEMALIREHAQLGCNILRDVESSWPLAQIVLQHHERMDGSGYPQGLRGGEILIEARILAVADVVEAMASHRPYRPAWGIGDALAEITRNRGTLYDPAAVDACRELFTEKGYCLV